MISLRFAEIKLEVKNALIENIGILGVFILQALKDNLKIDDISEITKFDKNLLEAEFLQLEKRGYLNNKTINKKGLDIVDIYNFIKQINNSSIIIDLYLKDFYFIKKDYLSTSAKFNIYSQRLFDHGILQKINNNKKLILEKLNTKKIYINYDNFEFSYKYIKNYFANFDKIILGKDEFPIGEKVLKVDYNIQNLKNNKIDVFKSFYFSLFSKEKYKNIIEYKGKTYLPDIYNINDIECNKKIDFNQICLANISVNLTKTSNKKFIDIEKMIKDISEKA